MPKYYPMLMNLEDQPVLVVGGGAIAARKAATMAEYGARVVMVAPQIGEEARRLAAEGRIQTHERPYDQSDLDTPRLVFAATDDPALHERIKAECDRRRLPCNVVDVPPLCSFIVPSILRRGELMITISTDGLCPAYAKYQRLRMEQCCFPQGADALLHVVAAGRNELKGPLGHGMSDEEKFHLLRRIIESDIVDVLAREGEEAACREARERIRALAARRPQRQVG